MPFPSRTGKTAGLLYFIFSISLEKAKDAVKFFCLLGVYCLALFGIMFGVIWHYAWRYLALCLALFGIMLGFIWHCLALFLALFGIMFGFIWHYVWLYLELCLALFGIIMFGVIHTYLHIPRSFPPIKGR